MINLGCKFVLPGFPQSNQVSHIPKLIRDTSSHRGRRAQGAMNLDEVVGEVPERNGGRMVVELFREAIRQPGEAPVRHADAKIVALHV